MKRLNGCHGFIAVLLALSMLSLVSCKGPEKRAYEAFVDSAKKTVDPIRLQQEAVVLLKKYPIGKEIPQGELPTELKNLPGQPPIDVRIGVWSGSPGGALMITWGNGFAHWGVIIGDEAFELPNVDYLSVTMWSSGVGFFITR